MLNRFITVTFLLTVALACALWAGAEPSGDESTLWPIAPPKRGAEHGEAGVTIHFPEPMERAPVTFGIPLGQVASPGQIVLLDELGKSVPADFEPLGAWEAQPARWTLVSCVLDAAHDSRERRFVLHWGEEGPACGSPLCMSVDGSEVKVQNEAYGLTISPCGIEAMEVGERAVHLETWGPAFSMAGRGTLRPNKGRIKVLHDGGVAKAVRFTSALTEALELHQEYFFYAASPYVRCNVRYVNRSTEDIRLGREGIVPLDAQVKDVGSPVAGLEDGRPWEISGVSVCQKAFAWCAVEWDESGERKVVAGGKEDNAGEWLCLPVSQEASVMLVFPFFQEMAAADEGAQSSYEYSAGHLALRHYAADPEASQEPDVRLREGMARTFTYWLVFNPPAGKEAAVARAVKAMPYVVYDRDFLTAMGVFQEQRVSHLFDEEVLEAALYYQRAQVPRPEYLRCSRGADPGPDKSGEGFYEVDLHAGGMVFGESFQYFAPQPPDSLVQRYHDEIGIPRKHIITGGQCTYRNGDIVLALFQQYLRSGRRILHDFGRIHAQVYADVSISHAPQSLGLGHYYCDWYGNPYVYQRFEGLLLASLVTGDAWWFETAQDMAEYCVHAWQDGAPRDGRLEGGYGGVQHRSPYIAKMLLRLFELTGDQRYADTAVRLAQWIIPKQQPEGWWTDTPGATREYRNSPIFAGYTAMGLWPLYHATKNEQLLGALMKTVDYHVGMQEDPSGNNPGTFPNSYWYRLEEGSKSKQPIPTEITIEGNYATTSHWANVIFQAYLATGNLDYFYSANAAWFGVLSHQTPEGGVPLSNDRDGSVWGHVMVESLPAFAAAAEERRLPMVLGSRTGAPVAAFMGKGAAYRDGVFAFGLKYKHSGRLPVRVYFPAGKPAALTVDGIAIEYRFSPADQVLSFEVPACEEYRTVHIALCEAR